MWVGRLDDAAAGVWGIPGRAAGQKVSGCAVCKWVWVYPFRVGCLWCLIPRFHSIAFYSWGMEPENEAIYVWCLLKKCTCMSIWTYTHTHTHTHMHRGYDEEALTYEFPPDSGPSAWESYGTQQQYSSERSAHPLMCLQAHAHIYICTQY